MMGPLTLKHGEAQCSCRKVYTAAHGCAVGGRIVCPDCARAQTTRLNLSAAQKNNRAATLNLRTAQRAATRGRR